MGNITIKDVAKTAGVSTSTVSRVLSGTASISEKTTKRVLDSVKKLNYTPNTAARCLRSNKSRSIGVIIPDISGEFYAGCASALLKYARDDGYTILFIESGHNLKEEKESINVLLEHRVDGMIFIGDNDDNSLIYEIASTVPVVTGDRIINGIPYAAFNNRKTVFELTTALYNSGSRRFVYVGEPIEGQDNLIDRYNGYLDAVSNLQDIKADTILDKAFHKDKTEAGYKLFKDKISTLKPDAVITSNDLIAYGIISAANEIGLKIPDDLAVTGFDNMISSAYFIPSLTTVNQNIDELAKNCFKMLKKVINKETVSSMIINQEIILRKSALASEELGEGKNEKK